MRRVDVLPAHDAEVEAEIRALDADCADGVLFLVEGLAKGQDPDPGLELAGVWNLRIEVFAMRIPDCRKSLLVVSIPTDGGTDGTAPALVHGIIAAGAKWKGRAGHRAGAQLGILGQAWEEAT